MNEKKPKFYYRGKGFSNEKDFWDGVQKYDNAQMTETTGTEIFEDFVNNIRLNLTLKNIDMTNAEFKKRLEKIFMHAINVIHND